MPLPQGDLESLSPIDGRAIGAVATASAARRRRRDRPAPTTPSSPGAPCRRRGAASWSGCSARCFARRRRRSGRLVSLEAGKILQEGLGEVQEMIDICDFAVGLSRQLYGLTIATERPGHRMMETWHPLGVVGVISAFNFPVAVWAWNACLAFVCGDPVVWKPSEKTPLTARRGAGPVRARGGAVRRRAGRPRPGGAGRTRDRRGAGRRSARGPGLGDRLDADGPGGRAAGGRALRADPARAWRQ